MNIDKNELINLIENLISSIEDNSLFYDESGELSIDLTIGCDFDGNWSYQTGSTQYIGPAYFHDVTTSVKIHPDSDPEKMADGIIRQLEEEFAWLEKEQ